MERNFVKEMNYSQVLKYKKPCIITLSGLPGSGKTTLAQEISRKLKIYLLSNDYIRNHYSLTKYYNEEQKAHIQSIILKINSERIYKLLLHHVSFVLDMGFNAKEQFDKFVLISKLLKYELIKIKINSSDEDNINRIGQRIFDLNTKDDNIVGDNISYSCSYPSSIYYEIKERKPPMLDGVNFDYIIDNMVDKQEFDQNIDQVIKNIKTSKLIVKKYK